MTDPWSVHNAKDTRQINSVNGTENIYNQDNIVDFVDDTQYLGFEDSFIQDNNCNAVGIANSDNATLGEAVNTKLHPLPDSEKYLQTLERKLEKLKKNAKLVDALAEKRDDCLRSMLQDNSGTVSNNPQLLELEANITNSDSPVQYLYRQIHPVQPLTVGETVEIVKFDQLEVQVSEAETSEELEATLPENH